MGYNPYADYSYGADIGDIGSTVGVVFLVMIVIYALVGLFAIAAYVLESLGMYTIAQRREIKHPWLAWLPFGNLWILGSIADQYQYVAQGKVRNRRKVLLGLQIAITALALAFFGAYIYVLVEMLFNIGGDMEMFAEETMVAFALTVVLLCLVMYVLSMVLMVFQYISLYKLYASCWPSCKVAFILLSIFVSVTEPFLVFACRNKDLGMPPRKAEPVSPTLIDPPAFEE